MIEKLGLLLILVCAALPALHVPAGDPGVRFRALDVHVDAGAARLAAWQVEISCDSPEARIVGVEGGETEEYSEPPWYDPAALQGGRIVLGAFTTAGSAPAGRTRVARIHVEEPAGIEPRYAGRIVAAAAPGGDRIEAKVEVQPTGGER